jgi:hypothetical protein
MRVERLSEERMSMSVEAKLRSRLPVAEAEAAIRLLSALGSPESSAAFIETRIRVQIAIAMLADGNLEKVDLWVKQSEIDWRDTLVAAGLAEANWRRVAKQAGYGVY